LPASRNSNKEPDMLKQLLIVVLSAVFAALADVLRPKK
jgi:hypothetical protein